MAAELMLINPRRRRRARRGRRRMSALQRKYFGGGRKRRHRRTLEVQTNPRHRRRRSRRHHIMRVRRNPIGGSSLTGVLKDTVAPAAIGAVGAVGVQYVLQALPLPTTFTSGIMAPVTGIAAAILMGWAVGSVAGRTAGENVAIGASVVTLYQFASQYFGVAQGGQSVSGIYGMNGRRMGRRTMGRMINMGRVGRVVGMAGRAGLGYMGPGRGVRMGARRMRPMLLIPR